MTEMQPTEHEVLQEESVPDLETVPVRVVSVDAPVRTQALPRKSATTQTRTLTAGDTAHRILTADPYRAQATLIADHSMYVSVHDLGADDAITSAWWPASVPLVITAVTDIWARAASAETDSVVGIIVERWATGDTHADD